MITYHSKNMDRTINEHILKISGRATLLEPIDLSKNYKIQVDGAITQVTDVDNQNGEYDRIYKFEPTVVTVLKDNGEITRTKDTRSRSQQLRAVITREWRESNENITAEEYYEREMKDLIARRINREI